MGYRNIWVITTYGLSQHMGYYNIWVIVACACKYGERVVCSSSLLEGGEKTARVPYISRYSILVMMPGAVIAAY